MKKKISIILTAILCITALSGCNESGPSTKKNYQSSSSSSQSSTSKTGSSTQSSTSKTSSSSKTNNSSQSTASLESERKASDYVFGKYSSYAHEYETQDVVVGTTQVALPSGMKLTRNSTRGKTYSWPDSRHKNSGAGFGESSITIGDGIDTLNTYLDEFEALYSKHSNSNVVHGGGSASNDLKESCEKSYADIKTMVGNAPTNDYTFTDNYVYLKSQSLASGQISEKYYIGENVFAREMITDENGVLKVRMLKAVKTSGGAIKFIYAEYINDSSFNDNLKNEDLKDLYAYEQIMKKF